ncbi:MAG: hypothetical protein J7L54_06700 [Elusimicrobia bacterium]|nr:hypothetical protein [Elusimicrobiota bacterium]
MKLSIKVRDYDFGKIFASGLFYFFYNSAPERKISAPGKTAKLSFRQEKDKLIISSDKGLDGKTVERIKYCLGADENLDRFYKLCRRDKVLKKFLKKIEKTRIVSAFTDLEAMVGAVVSQNNSYRNYRTQMKRICDKTNFEKKSILKNLKNFKVGYKAAYLENLAENFGKIPLEKIKGIGRYSINLFEIFQKRNYSAFYVDCLMEKIMREGYGIKSDFEKKSEELWGNLRGLAEAYLQRFFEKK